MLIYQSIQTASLSVRKYLCRACICNEHKELQYTIMHPTPQMRQSMQLSEICPLLAAELSPQQTL